MNDYMDKLTKEATEIPKDVRHKLFNMGYYDKIVIGYLILGMRNEGFTDSEVERAVLGLRTAFKEKTIREAERTSLPLKYATMTEIFHDETLSLSEMEDAMWQFLEEKGMTMEEFMATEEGRRVQDVSDMERLGGPIAIEVVGKDDSK